LCKSVPPLSCGRNHRQETRLFINIFFTKIRTVIILLNIKRITNIETKKVKITNNMFSILYLAKKRKNSLIKVNFEE